MRNTKPPKKPKRTKTNHPFAQAPLKTINADRKDASFAEFAAVTADVCHGLHSYLRTIEQHKPSTIGRQHSFALQRLAIASAWLLHEHANKQLKSFNDQGLAATAATKLH